jgi:uncharacterized protein
MLSLRAEVRYSAYGRMKGLIGKPADRFPRGSGLWILPCNGIHTFGMRFPIDAVYLDSQERVVRMYQRLVPFRIGSIIFKAKSVLELPAGALEMTRTQVGDELEFRPLVSEKIAT